MRERERERERGESERERERDEEVDHRMVRGETRYIAKIEINNTDKLNKYGRAEVVRLEKEQVHSRLGTPHNIRHFTQHTTCR